MVNTIFGFINLALLLLLSIYVFKNYLIDSLDEAIEEQESYLTGLKNQHKNLHKLEYKINKNIDFQEKYISELKNKVLQWRELVGQQEASDREKRQTQLAQVNAKRLKQAEFFLLAKTERLVSPLVKKQLEHELKLYFDSKENAYEYINRIENNIKML